MLVQDFVLDDQIVGNGEIAEALGGMRMGQGMRFDPGLLRPFRDESGKSCVIVNSGRTKFNPTTNKQEPIYVKKTTQEMIANGVNIPVFNDTMLSKQQWIQLTSQVIKAARYRLRAYADLSAANSYGGFDGMSHSMLEDQQINDVGEAVQDMDGLGDGRGDAPSWTLQGVPLPITSVNFHMSKRKLMSSQNNGMQPLNTMMAEMAGRRIGEKLETQLIGNSTGLTYGGQNNPSYGRTSKVYGYLNFPQRLTYTSLTAPSAGGWTPKTTIDNILAMRQLMFANKFYGPFMIYHSNDWDQYLDADYAYVVTSGAVAPTQTLRNRLRQLPDIQDVRRLDMLFAAAPTAGGPGYTGMGLSLNPFTLIMVQMTPDVCQAVNGLDISTIQWESHGGMRLNFKVMAIQVPWLHADQYGNCGILQATTS